MKKDVKVISAFFYLPSHDHVAVSISTTSTNLCHSVISSNGIQIYSVISDRERLNVEHTCSCSHLESARIYVSIYTLCDYPLAYPLHVRISDQTGTNESLCFEVPPEKTVHRSKGRSVCNVCLCVCV